MAQRFRPDEARLTALGYRSIAHVPVVFASDGRYLRKVNRYLRERATLAWPESIQLKLATGRPIKYPRTQTLLKIADSLVNFSDWLEARSYDWRRIQYTSLRLYAKEQREGRWSRANRDGSDQNRRLTDGTIKPRLGYATDFLNWAAAHGLRPAFDVPNVALARSFASETSSRPAVRRACAPAGRFRQNPINLRLPTVHELRTWLAQVLERRGYTKCLACRTMLGIALRREECCQLPVDFLPMNQQHWNVSGGRVYFPVTEGTKGGKPRIACAPLALCEELHRYRTGQRVRALAKWIKTHRGEEKPTQLFLSAHDGRPLSAPGLYTAYTSYRIFPGWSPHLARHTWACYELLFRLSHEARSAGFELGSVPTSWLESTAKTMISLFIKPILGHIDENTTLMYLRWLHAQLTLEPAFRDWHDFLESTDAAPS